MFLVFSHPKNCASSLQESRISKSKAQGKNGVKSAKPVFKILFLLRKPKGTVR
jgi:hypothetical protein